MSHKGALTLVHAPVYNVGVMNERTKGTTMTEKETTTTNPAPRLFAEDANADAGYFSKLWVSNLPADEELISPPVTPALAASIADNGIMEPIVVVREANESGDELATPVYRVVEGRRRVKAARAAGIEYVPARIYDAAVLDKSIYALTTHATRNDNPASDLQAIETLLAAGYDRDQIADAAKLTKSTVNKILGLQRLYEPLRDLFERGEMTSSAAFRAARLHMDVQTELYDKYLETGKVRVKDVEDARKVQVDTAVEDMSFDDILAPEDDGEVGGDPAHAPAPDLLANALLTAGFHAETGDDGAVTIEVDGVRYVAHRV